MVVKYLKLLIIFLKMNIKSERSFGKAFFSKVLLMIINNFVLLLMWILFFQRIGQIGDWKTHHVILLFSTIGLSIGIADYFGYYSRFLSTIIYNGSFDYYLKFPISPFFHFVFRNNSLFAIGDIIFAFITFVIGIFSIGNINFTQFAFQTVLFIFCGICGAIVYISFNITVNSLGFFLGKIDKFSREMSFSVVLFGTYPEPLFAKFKFILYTVIPAGFVAFLPISIITAFDMKKILLMISGSLAFFIIAFIVFNIGIKCYKSANSQINTM